MLNNKKLWIGIGDIHDDISMLNNIKGLKEADGVIISGDITFSGKKDKAKKVFNAIENINKNIYAQIGNMDYQVINDYLDEAGYNIHATGKEILPDLGIIGTGYSSLSPFNTPSEVEDKQLGIWLKQAYDMIKHLKQFIMVTHDPPFGTKLDRIEDGTHVGSRAVLDFVKQYQPPVLLCGHIHESKGFDMIGKTKAVNPGMLSEGTYAIITYDNGKLDIELHG